MDANISNLDRAVRLILGSLFVAMGFNAELVAFVSPVWFFIAAAGLILTGLLGRCPVYRLMGISTCPK
jgi:hypothetical protein